MQTTWVARRHREEPDDRKSPAPVRPRRALLVEDDDEMRAMLGFVLARAGFEVTALADGAAALECLGEWLLQDGRHRPLPDLLVTDQRMPGCEGLRVIEAFRLARIPVPAILITAFGDEPLLERAMSLGGTVMLDKPFDLSDLVNMARSLVRRGAPPSVPGSAA